MRGGPSSALPPLAGCRLPKLRLHRSVPPQLRRSPSPSAARRHRRRLDDGRSVPLLARSGLKVAGSGLGRRWRRWRLEGGSSRSKAAAAARLLEQQLEGGGGGSTTASPRPLYSAVEVPSIGSRLPAGWQLLFRVSLPVNCYCLILFQFFGHGHMADTTI
uniref:Uncharacterized protein n=2 Tax=Oryza nivara TaxID=4536 RepID=A0A0E0HB49_ORYNI